ncbi:MAG: hypothetical protein AB7U66_18205, partial [Hyphomicrobiaceae bacterium]
RSIGATKPVEFGMTQHLIDDEGELWSSPSQALRARFETPYCGSEFEDFLVRNFGYIAVTRRNRSIRVRVRPARASEKALYRLVFLLFESSSERVALSTLAEDQSDWQDALFTDSADAIARIMMLSSDAQDPRPDAFFSRPRALDGLGPANPFVPLIEHWRARSGHFERTSFLERLVGPLQDRYLMIRLDGRSERLSFEEVGGGFPLLDRSWLDNFTGVRVEDQPDYYYARWVAESYRHAAKMPIPTVHDIDALVRRPKLGTKRLRYQRLILPFTREDGSTLMLGSSFLDESINLRIKAS